MLLTAPAFDKFGKNALYNKIIYLVKILPKHIPDIVSEKNLIGYYLYQFHNTIEHCATVVLFLLCAR